MNGFIGNILRRHTDSVANIVPRLPGRFEAISFPAGNSTKDLSSGTEDIRPFHSIQRITDISIDNKRSADISEGKTISSFDHSIVANQKTQPLNNSGPLNEIVNTSETSIIKNILPADNSPAEKMTGENVSEVKRSGFNKVKPINTFKEKPPVENFGESEPAGKGLTNSEPVRSNRKDDNKNEQDLPVKQNIIKPAIKGNHVLEDAKHLQATLVKPLTQNLNAGANHNTSPALREQNISTVIKVSIGRIEVRAITSAALGEVNRPVLQKPRLSLDEYLKIRSGSEK